MVEKRSTARYSYLNEVERSSLQLGALPQNIFWDGNDVEKWNGEAERQAATFPTDKPFPVNAAVDEVLSFFGGGTILDVGCGTGLMSFSVPKDWNYIGVDQNQ